VFAVLPHLGRHLAQFGGSAVVVVIAASAGTYLEPGTDLRSPLLDTALARRPFVRRSAGLLSQALLVGVVTSVVLIAIDRTLFSASVASRPVWTGVLYALFGGASEEVIFHYGLLTAVAWLALRLLPGAAAYWVAIVISSVALGLSHLGGPLLPVSAPAPMRALVLTTMVGVVTGWLYWRRGLEAAMLCHGLISFALHVAAPGV
jgi:membrane protease YdiL (CAAX protease family)